MAEVHVSTMLLIHMRSLLLLIEFCWQRVLLLLQKKKERKGMMTAREGIRMVFFSERRIVCMCLTGATVSYCNHGCCHAISEPLPLAWMERGIKIPIVNGTP